MAKIQKTKNTVIESWKVSWHDGEMSRSKAIQDHDDAVKFKALVEEGGDLSPATSVLAENGLIQYAEWVHPGVLLGLRELIKDSTESDKETLGRIRALLDIALDVPR